MPMSKNKLIGGTLVRALTALSIVLGGVSAAAGAAAGEGSQPGSTQAASDSSDTLEEVVVTAETYKSTTLTTPISISALSGSQLASSGITSLEQVARDVPGLSMRSSGPNQTEFEARLTQMNLHGEQGLACSVELLLSHEREFPLIERARVDTGARHPARAA